jgi:hypothetical protein
VLPNTQTLSVETNCSFVDLAFALLSGYTLSKAFA